MRSMARTIQSLYLKAFTFFLGRRNQRQLFLNIANGAYDTQRLSSVSSRLADLVQEMLRKNPRERPSINAILKKPLIRDRIQVQFLSLFLC